MTIEFFIRSGPSLSGVANDRDMVRVRMKTLVESILLRNASDDGAFLSPTPWCACRGHVSFSSLFSHAFCDMPFLWTVYTHRPSLTFLRLSHPVLLWWFEIRVELIFSKGTSLACEQSEDAASNFTDRGASLCTCFMLLNSLEKIVSACLRSE